MSNEEIIRRWKDEEYRVRNPLLEETAEPANPAGAIELPADLVGAVSGGVEAGATVFSLCCTSYPCLIEATTAMATVNLSCSPTCDKTMNVGTCGWSSYGCCTPDCTPS